MQKFLFVFLFLAVTTSSFGVSFDIQNIVWTSPVNVTISGNSLTQNGAANQWNAGAFSTQYIAAGKNGYVETTAQETTSHRMFGLSDFDTNAVYNTIDYALYMTYGGTIQIYENGSYMGNFGTYTTGSVFRVAREGTEIKYYHNSSLIRTVANGLTVNLYADTSSYELNSTIYNAKIAVEVIPEPSCMLLFFISALVFAASRLRR